MCSTLLSNWFAVFQKQPRVLNRVESVTFNHTNLFVTHSGVAEMPFPPLVSQPPSSLVGAPPSPYVPPVLRVRLELPQSP